MEPRIYLLFFQYLIVILYIIWINFIILAHYRVVSLILAVESIVKLKYLGFICDHLLFLFCFDIYLLLLFCLYCRILAIEVIMISLCCNLSNNNEILLILMDFLAFLLIF